MLRGCDSKVILLSENRRLRDQGTAYADPSEQETTIHKVASRSNTERYFMAKLRISEQIMAILRIAKLSNQKTLVLGAFGCGVRLSEPKR